MKKIDCGVIRDLLPLYVDNAASEESQELVREHLAGCPGCQEELRKLRKPITLPPNGDEEAVKRFLEYRAEVRRKQNGKLTCFLAVSISLILFLLCYALIPRSWSFMSRNVEPVQIMGSYLGSNPDFSIPESWNIDDGYEKDSAVIEEFLDALRSVSYRAELRNVMNYTPLYRLFQNTTIYGSGGTIDLYLIKGANIPAIVTLHSTNTRQIYVRIRFSGSSIVYFYRADSALYDDVFALMQKYGNK